MGNAAILIYDFGTTALKTSLYDKNLNLVDCISREFHYEYPQKGFVEMDPELYWELALSSAIEILERNNCKDSVDIISVTGQAETIIPVGKDGKYVRKAIVWPDTRAEKESGYLKSKICLEDFYNKTGLTEIGPVWPVNKIAWIRNNESEVYKRTFKFLLLKDYILYRLTGEIVSDPTVCSWSGCFDIRSRVWWQDILDIMEIDKQKLPNVRESLDIIGTLRKDVQTTLGLTGKVRVVNGLLDQCASVIGAGNIRPGGLTETTGTVLALATMIDDINTFNPKGLINIMCHGIPGRHMALTYCNTAGILLKWFKDNFCEKEIYEAQRQNRNVYALLDDMAGSIDKVDPKLVLLPHFCGCTYPESNQQASGVLFGLDLGTGKAHIIKAIMEAVAFLLRENINFIENNGFPIRDIISLGGAAKSPVWLQIKSDVLNRKIITLENEESASLGCAFMAGLSAGLYTDINYIKKIIRIKKEYFAESTRTEAYERKYRLYLDLYGALRNLYNRI